MYEKGNFDKTNTDRSLSETTVADALGWWACPILLPCLLPLLLPLLGGH